MVDPIQILKTRARALHRAAQAGDPAALARLRHHRELRELDDEGLRAAVRRRHCLARIADEHGFGGWNHAARVLGGADDDEDDFGTLLYPPGASAHWNIWSARYEEASAIRRDHGGFLLAYRRHFLIVDEHFIATLGLDPGDPDWAAIGRDWARPGDPAARSRLYGKLLALGREHEVSARPARAC